MWVNGDLKDQLGIRHRKASKNARASDLETAPMFREPHARSASELTLSQVYEPTRVAESEMNKKRSRGYTNDSLDTDADGDVDVKRRSTLIPVGSSEMVDLHADLSPHPSYYSSSDIPIPSPIPPSLYRFADGEVGERQPRRSSSRGASSSPTSIPPLPTVGEAFEMQVRPSHSQTHSRSGSQGFRQHVPAYSSEDALPSPFEAVSGDEARPESWIGGRAL
jgi:phospholipid-translocating ATPase